MTPHMDLGLCYRLVYQDGKDLEFRYLGSDPQGQWIVETPIGSSQRRTLTARDYSDLYEIDTPYAAQETVTL